MLEGYTYDEPWPVNLDDLKLVYSSGEQRDMDKVRRQVSEA